MIPSRLTQPGAAKFWAAVLLTGAGAGIAAAGLTVLLQWIQRLAWGGDGTNLVAFAAAASPLHHLAVLLGAGLLVGVGQVLLTRLSSGNGIDTTEAIWFRAGRLPAIRTLGSALLSIIIVGMGVSLGREGAPKQAGAVAANCLCDRFVLDDDQRRLLVACGAGAGMAAAYGVPLGGALFALEVLRRELALRLVLPALLACVVATLVSWIALPDAHTYLIPAYASTTSSIVWAFLAGPLAGVAAVGYVRLIALADRHKPQGQIRLLAPLLGLGLLGVVSLPLPQLLGNGKDVAALAMDGSVAFGLMAILVVLKPLATFVCIGSGAPGGLFTPTLAFGALLGGLLGYVWSLFWPGTPLGLFAVLGAAAVLAATTQGPISTTVLMVELTGRGTSFMVPLLAAVASATLVARTIEPRSIYDSRLSDAELAERQRLRA